MSETKRHWMRILVIWAAVTAAAVPIIILVWGPHMPPGGASAPAHGQQFDNWVLGATGAPIVAFILVYFGYSLVVFRRRGPDIEDGPPIREHTGLQTLWVVGTLVIVLWAAAFGSFEWVGNHYGAGSGQGPVPIAPVPVSAHPLVVQVIAQQWWFNYRYPQYRGVETMHLVLPVGRLVQFNVTSLDVVHSFWAYQLAVKADAVPGALNIAYTTPTVTGPIWVRCAELCGLWHGEMFDTQGRVVSDAAFDSWIAGQERSQGPFLKYLPPYSNVYYPEPVGRAG